MNIEIELASQSEARIASAMTNKKAPLVVTCDQWVLSDDLLGSHNHTDTSQGQWGINCEAFKIRNETKVSELQDL